jgi:hypothetical protein
MSKRVLSVAVAVLIINAVCGVRVSAAAQGQGAGFGEKVKEAVARLGPGPETRVEVGLGNRSKVKGYIGEIKADEFTVVDPKHGTASAVAYGDVIAFKGRNAKTGEKASISYGSLSGKSSAKTARTILLVGGLAAVVIIIAVSVHASGQH